VLAIAAFVPILASGAKGSSALPGFARQFQGVRDVETNGALTGVSRIEGSDSTDATRDHRVSASHPFGPIGSEPDPIDATL
jgi:hypothetical protein